MSQFFIGTSGWSYPSFRGIFYPPGLPSKEWLRFYAERFPTVEINVTFYRTPRPSTFARWYAETPSHFIFAVKAPKLITHLKKLRQVEEDLKNFLKALSPLKEKAKVLLFQLPPSLIYDREVLKEFLLLLPKDYLSVIEIRHKSFHHEEFYAHLRERNVALCLSDFGGKYPSWVEVRTASFLYFRMHGAKKIYFSNYEEEELRALVETIKRIGKPEDGLPPVEKVFVYFDNTGLGFAVSNALRLKELLQENSDLF